MTALDWTIAVSEMRTATAPERCVLFALVRWIDWSTGEAYPSIASIARACGVNERTCQRIIARLVECGYLTVSRSTGGTRKETNRYRANLDRIRADATTGGTKPPVAQDHRRRRATGGNGYRDGWRRATPTGGTEPPEQAIRTSQGTNTGAPADAGTPGDGFALTADEPRKADWTPPAGCWGNARYGIVFDRTARRFVWRDDAERAKDFAAWADTYPAVDCESELRRAAEWCLSGARGRKGNYRRFIVTWLGRAQDRGGTRGAVAGGFGARTPHGQRKALEDATDWSGLSADDAQRQADELIGRGSAA